MGSQIIYGDQTLDFRVRYLEGINRKVAIHVQPDQQVVIDAPTGTSIKTIKEALLKRARWVNRQQQTLQQLHRNALPRHTPDQDPALTKAFLHNWYLKRAEAVFGQRLAVIYPELNWVKQKPPWQLRAMKKQWDSCSPKGKLSLNPLLVKAPRVCIDYVITHELCHLKHHNHSEGLFNLIEYNSINYQYIRHSFRNFSISRGRLKIIDLLLDRVFGKKRQIRPELGFILKALSTANTSPSEPSFQLLRPPPCPIILTPSKLTIRPQNLPQKAVLI